MVAVAADPKRQAVFYFGAVAGGVWKSDDAGQYWENVTDGFLTTGSIGALAVAPSDGNVIYAGTGESTIRIDVTHGDGVYKSTDAGTTWRHIGLPSPATSARSACIPTTPTSCTSPRSVTRRRTTPSAGCTGRRTAARTGSWCCMSASAPVPSTCRSTPTTRASSSPRSGRPGARSGRSTAAVPTAGCGVLATAATRGRTSVVSPGMPDGTLGKIGVAVSPARSGRVFAMVEAEGRKRGLYRSDDFGETWEKVSSKPDLGWRPVVLPARHRPPDGCRRGVRHEHEGVAIDRRRQDVRGVPHAARRQPCAVDRSDEPRPHDRLRRRRRVGVVQRRRVVVDDLQPADRAVLPRGHRRPISVHRVRIAAGQLEHRGAQPRPVSARSTGPTATRPGTAESGYVAPKPGDPNIVYVGAIGSSPGGGESLQRYDHTTKQVQLVNVWPEAYHDGNTAEVRFQWTYPIVFSPHDSNVLYAAGNKVFRTTDEGHSWETISPDLTYADPDTMGVSGPLTMDTAGAEMYATIFSLMVSAHQQGVLMAGSDDGLVHLSTNDGGDWANVTPPDLPKFSQVTMIAESPHTAGTIYMTAARHKTGDYAPYVYKTADLGTTWTRIDAGLPQHEFCRVIREDPNRAGSALRRHRARHPRVVRRRRQLAVAAVQPSRHADLRLRRQGHRPRRGDARSFVLDPRRPHAAAPDARRAARRRAATC